MSAAAQTKSKLLIAPPPFLAVLAENVEPDTARVPVASLSMAPP
jgi:hypothetical protein